MNEKPGRMNDEQKRRMALLTLLLPIEEGVNRWVKNEGMDKDKVATRLMNCWRALNVLGYNIEEIEKASNLLRNHTVGDWKDIKDYVEGAA